MDQKSWAILWQHFDACTVRKAVFSFVDSNVQHETSLLSIKQIFSWFLTKIQDIRKFFLSRICSMRGYKKNRLKKHLSGECTSGESAGLWLD